jgi:peptidoglycan/xylan/chitin deacetylase (PgdA/CDA1 family)
MALGAYGTQAESALPALRELPDDPDQFGRRVIPRSIVRVQCELRDGGIVRGPKERKQIALVFTGHEFAEGGETILHELAQRQGRAAFFLTGTFLQNPQFKPLVSQMVANGHYLGPHSDKHLLYCAGDESRRTLVSEAEFTGDLLANAAKLPGPGAGARRFNRYFLPAFEHYNREIVDWTRQQRWTLINFTPGTRSNADYTGEADTNFVSSATIFDSIVKREREDSHGLNGFILLFHLGSGPGRADKFHLRFGELLDALGGQGYQFVRVDELLGPRRETNAPKPTFFRQAPVPAR